MLEPAVTVQSFLTAVQGATLSSLWSCLRPLDESGCSQSDPCLSLTEISGCLDVPLFFTCL